MTVRSLVLMLLMGTIPVTLHAQLKPGFIPEEARDMAALCTTTTFNDLYGSDEPMIPDGYTKVYSSLPTGLDNKFEVFTKGDLGVVEIRGSTATMQSWLVNIYSSMIPVKGSLKIDGERYDYHFADDTSAAVHAGYSVAVVTIAKDVIGQLHELSEQGINNIIITGHSQGAAVAHLLRAYLEHLPNGSLPEGMKFKTYAFASPMVGDDAFVKEYQQKFCTRLSSFNIRNPQDPVVSLPVSYNAASAFSIENLVGMLTGGMDQAKSTARSALFNMFSEKITSLAAFTSGSVEKRVEDAMGEVELPPFRQEMNYATMETVIPLEPFDYPLILQDSTILHNDSIMAAEPRNAQGVFLNRDLYRDQPRMYQHKPYNYYVAILKEYFPEEYRWLDVKILPENL